MSIQEHVILVNDRGMVIGTQENTLHIPPIPHSIWRSLPRSLMPKGVSYHPSRIKQKPGRASDELSLRPSAIW